MTTLSDWGNFYVVVGSSAGALIGLQFVAMTLIANRRLEASQETGGAFATPTIVHFGVVLFLAALVNAPWQGFIAVAVTWGLVGLIGIIYIAVVTRRLKAQNDYKPVLEDWLLHVLLPLVAYLGLVVSAIWAFSHLRESLFGVGAAALLLLFIGIHNAWDSVAYIFFVKKSGEAQETNE